MANYTTIKGGTCGGIRTHTTLLLRQLPLPLGYASILVLETGLEPVLPYGKRILSPLRLPVPPFQVVSCQELASCCRVSQTRVLLHELATGGGPEWERSTASGFSVPCTTTNYTTDPFCLHSHEWYWHFATQRGIGNSNSLEALHLTEEHLHAMQGF